MEIDDGRAVVEVVVVEKIVVVGGILVVYGIGQYGSIGLMEHHTKAYSTMWRLYETKALGRTTSADGCGWASTATAPLPANRKAT